MPAPQVSIVIPTYNEQAILERAVLRLVQALRSVDWSYELLIAENGSTDRTEQIAAELSERLPQVRYLHCDEPNYGEALKTGILAAAGELVICEEIDLCDTGFHEEAVAMLREAGLDLVIGSKAMRGAVDERPVPRRLATLAINAMLRIAFGFRGTDTHGLKAFRRASLLPIVRRCVVDRDLFASELVIRAERAGLRIEEIPVRVLELRPPSVGLLRRVPQVLRSFGQLVVAIRAER